MTCMFQILIVQFATAVYWIFSAHRQSQTVVRKSKQIKPLALANELFFNSFTRLSISFSLASKYLTKAKVF